MFGDSLTCNIDLEVGFSSTRSIYLEAFRSADNNAFQASARGGNTAEIKDLALDGALGHLFSIELDIDPVGLSGHGGEGDQALAATQHVHFVRHTAIIDGYLQLAFSGLRGIHYKQYNIGTLLA